MSLDSKQLRHKRQNLIDQGRQIIDKAKEENREINAEERANYNKMFGEQNELKAQIEVLERQESLDKEMNAALELRHSALELDARKGIQEPGDKLAKEDRANGEVSADQKAKEVRALFNKFLCGTASEREVRNLQADLAVKGGYLVAPQVMAKELIANVTDEVILRGLCKVETLTQAASLGYPKLRNRMAAASWSSELLNASADSALDFGKREFFPHPGSAFIKVSSDLLRLAAIDPEAIVNAELGRVRGELEENAFLTGNGVKQPLGLFTASDDGIDSSRDVSTDNAATSPTFNGLKRAKFKIKPQYRRNAKWLFHDDLIMAISMIKDADGRYIWVDSVREGEPDRLLGVPVVSSMFAPNTMTSGQYVGIIGDFQQYQIVDVLALEIKRLDELYAMTNEVGFLTRFHVDGAPKVAEAFARVKLG